MPKLANPLTDTQTQTAKPQEKAYTMANGGGMYLAVMPSGSKFWRMAYRQPSGKNNRLTFGPYPEISLLDARTKRAAARKLLAEGIDAGQAKREDKHATKRSSHPYLLSCGAYMVCLDGADRH